MALLLTYLQLSQDIDKNPPVKHRLAIHSGDQVLDLLEGEASEREASELLHYLDGALHLLTLEGEERLLRVIELLEIGPVEKSGYRGPQP